MAMPSKFCHRMSNTVEVIAAYEASDPNKESVSALANRLSIRGAACQRDSDNRGRNTLWARNPK